MSKVCEYQHEAWQPVAVSLFLFQSVAFVHAMCQHLVTPHLASCICYSSLLVLVTVAPLTFL